MAELTPRAPDFGRHSAPDLDMACEPFLGLVKVQGHDGAADAPLQLRLGGPLPAANREGRFGPVACAWLAPGEWLLIGERAALLDLSRPLETSSAGQPILVTEITHGRVALRLAGARVPAVLLRHCPLDLHPDVFPTGSTARTLLGDIPIHLSRLDDAPSFRLIVDQSQAEAAWRLLLLAAASASAGEGP